MNWKEIKEKYPKAFNECLRYFYLFESFYENDEYASIGWHIDKQNNLSDKDINEGSGSFPIRDLYDFFDKNGILIFIKRHKISSNANDCTFVIDSYKNGVYSKFKPTMPLYSRIGTEEVAFEKAFELFEKNLA